MTLSPQLTRLALLLPLLGLLACGKRGERTKVVTQTLPASSSDDHGGDTASASSLSLGVAMAGRVEFAADSDWFAVQLISGTDYEFKTLQPSDGMDSVLRLLAGDGTTELDKNDDAAPGEPNSRILFTATSSGAHYLSVAHVDSNAAQGGYVVLAQEQTPSVGYFQPAARLNEGRIPALMTIVLNDGRVLVAGGGIDTDHSHATSELYDPLTDTWEYTDDVAPVRSDGLMLLPSGAALARSSHNLVQLADGRVLVVGGWGYETNRLLELPAGAHGDDLAWCHFFSPDTNTFRLAAAGLSVPRQNPMTTLLPNGQVLVAGGMREDRSSGGPVWSAYDVVDLFDPVTEQAVALTPLPTRRTAGVLATVGNRTLLFGGADFELLFSATPANAFPADTVLEFDVGSGLFRGGPALPGRYAPGFNGWSDRYYLAGGWDPTGGEAASTHVYDPTTGTITDGPLLPVAVGGPMMATIGTGPAQLLTGGYTTQDGVADTCTVWDVDKGTMTQLKMFSRRMSHHAVTLKDGRVLVIGGSDIAGGTPLVSCEIYLPQ